MRVATQKTVWIPSSVPRSGADSHPRPFSATSVASFDGGDTVASAWPAIERRL